MKDFFKQPFIGLKLTLAFGFLIVGLWAMIFIAGLLGSINGHHDFILPWIEMSVLSAFIWNNVLLIPGFLLIGGVAYLKDRANKRN